MQSSRPGDRPPVAVLSSRSTAPRHRAADPVVIPNAVDPAIFYPPAEPRAARREAGPGRRDELVGQPAEGRRHAPVASTESSTTSASSSRSSARTASSLPASWPARLAGARRAPPHAGRLPRPEPGRSVLQRAPRGARVRSSGGLPRQRRPPRARRRGRPAVSRGRGAGRGPRATRRRARRAAGGDRAPPDLVGRRPLPGGPRPRDAGREQT